MGRGALTRAGAQVAILFSLACNDIAGIETIPLVEAGPDVIEIVTPTSAFVGTWSISGSTGSSTCMPQLSAATLSGVIVFASMTGTTNQIVADTSGVTNGGCTSSTWVVVGDAAALDTSTFGCVMSAQGATETISAVSGTITLGPAGSMTIHVQEQVNVSSASGSEECALTYTITAQHQ